MIHYVAKMASASEQESAVNTRKKILDYNPCIEALYNGDGVSRRTGGHREREAGRKAQEISFYVL